MADMEKVDVRSSACIHTSSVCSLFSAKECSYQATCFCDASEKALVAIAYLYVIYEENEHYVGFVIWMTKAAPLHGHTIRRLELCSALLAVEIFQLSN